MKYQQNPQMNWSGSGGSTEHCYQLHIPSAFLPRGGPAPAHPGLERARRSTGPLPRRHMPSILVELESRRRPFAS